MSEWQKEEVLRELYHGQNMSMREIADELGCSHHPVYSWMKKHGISTERPYQNKDKLQELYDDGLTSTQIAEKLGVSDQTIYHWTKKLDIDTDGRERQLSYMLKKPPGHRITQQGYEKVFSHFRGVTNSTVIHRLVAVAHGELEPENYGDKNVAVHHKNEIPWDNRPENLEVMSASDHMEHHNPVLSRWGDDDDA